MTPMSTATVIVTLCASDGGCGGRGSSGLGRCRALLGTGLGSRLLVLVEEEVLIAHVQSSCMSLGRVIAPVSERVSNVA